MLAQSPAFDTPLREAADLAADLFAQLRAPWPQGGVMRDTYGAGEQHGHEVIRTAGRRLGLQDSVDAAGNLWLTLPGRDRSARAWLTGSHLDSVPDGGNYDGAAGVVAALAAVAALRSMGRTPQRDVIVAGFRAEEASSWYQGDFDSHVGSRAALGLLDPAELQRAVRIEDGRTLYETMQAAGLAPEEIRLGRRSIEPARCHGYLELHIEQGPVLVSRDLPVGIVTGIRGSARARSARCTGEYAHSGAVPYVMRRDAVLATAEFCHRMDEAWTRAREDAKDLVFTVGRLGTDPAAHSTTKIPGEVRFSIDLRSQDSATLDEMTELARALAGQIGARRGVCFDLGRFNRTEPARMDDGLIASLRAGADAMGLQPLLMPSGASHDAQDFARAGVPAAMIFVRNDHGSHNQAEAMDLVDFMKATRLLTWQLTQ